MKEKEKAEACENASSKTNYLEATTQPEECQDFSTLLEEFKELDFKQELEILKELPTETQKEILRDKIAEIEKKLKKYKREIKQKICRIKKEVPEAEHIIYLAFLNLLHGMEVKPLLNRNQQLLMLKQAICPKKQQNFLDWELSKEKARQTNIVYVAEQLGMKVKSQGRNFIARCPFHEDKNPSFYLYSDTNTFHCFGCGEHGDVIDLYMKLAGVEFKTAVKELAG